MTSETQCSAEMPKYRCHKIVHALKIHGIGYHTPDGDSATLIVERGFAPIAVDSEWLTRFPANPDPNDRGYYVVYEDGYKSWSPTKAFEKGYTRITDQEIAEQKAIDATKPHSLM